MSKRDYKNYAGDILEHIEDIKEFVENMMNILNTYCIKIRR
jgi:uncharacterized protein with HEPN domain